MSLIILAFWSCWWDFLSFIEMQFQYTSTKPKRFKTDAHISSLRDIRKSKIDWPYTIWLDKQFFRNFDYLIFIWGFEVYLFETPLYSNHTCLLDILQCWQKKIKIVTPANLWLSLPGLVPYARVLTWSAYELITGVKINEWLQWLNCH